jgi:hypothetical protein
MPGPRVRPVAFLTLKILSEESDACNRHTNTAANSTASNLPAKDDI